MTREQYIERLIAIYKLRYKPSQEEIEEFKLLMEMMPDQPIFNLSPTSPSQKQIPWVEPKPYDRAPVVVMYGVQVPDTMCNESNSTAYTISKTDEKGR